MRMGRVIVTAALFTILTAGAATAQMFDQYGGYTGLKGTNTSGFFRTEKINGRYWLITPENNVFWSTGICVLQFNDTWGGYCPTLQYYPNPYGNKAKYAGGMTEWASTMHDRMDRWGFNTNACWGVANIQNRVECIRDLSLCSRASTAGCRMVTSDFPDVWDPKWESTCDSTAKSQLSANKDNPWTIGAFPYNELHWTGPSGFKSIPDAYIALPATAYGKVHWANVFLKSKYATIADLNAAYGTAYADWPDLLNVTSLPDDAAHPARLADKIDFMEDIADRFYSICTFYMRKYDPNHLVFTTRWAMWWAGYGDAYSAPFSERIWKKAGEYCDVFANNGYVDFAYTEANFHHSSRVFQQSGKPFIVTEHARLANDSYFAYSSNYAPTQMDRGSWYYDQIKKLLDIGVADDPNDPGNPAKTCMGMHWFQCYDEPALGRPDGEKAQFGVFNCQDEAFLPFVEMAKSVNSQIYDYAITGTAFDVPEAPTAVTPVKTLLQQSEKASSYERVYYATQMSHATGSEVADPDASLGKAWKATVAGGGAGAYMVYGPYGAATSVWPGAQCTVRYRLKSSVNTTTAVVARPDVTTNGGAHVLANSVIVGTDFASPNAYQEFSLSFTTPNPSEDNWEFRVLFTGASDVSVDKIRVTVTPPSAYVSGPLSDATDATIWSSAEHATADAVEDCAVYLGSTSRLIDSISLIAGSSTAAGLPVDFLLQYSLDNVNWVTIPGQEHTGFTGHAGANEFAFPAVACKYVRVRATRLGQDAEGRYRLMLGGIDLVQKATTATPTFTWNYGGSAASYTLLMSPVAHFPEEQTIKVEGITETSYTPSVPLAQGTWYWTVKAVNAAGHEGKYMTTVPFMIGALPNSQFDHTQALACERMTDWRNMGNADTGGDGYSFAFVDDTVKTQGNSSLRVAITVNSLNKSTSQINAGTSDIPFAYAGRPLDYSAVSNFTFDVYPKRYCDNTGAIVPSTKYVRFRMVDASGNVAADQAIDAAGTLPVGQWSTVTISLTGPRYQINRLEFYVQCGATRLTWDERVFFNIDNIAAATLADLTPPTTPQVAVSGYTVNNIVWASASSSDSESGIAEYLYAIGSTPGADDLVPWKSNGASPNITETVSLAEGQVCYVSAKARNGISVMSDVGTSAAVRKVRKADGVNDARSQPLGSWVGLEGHVVVARFPGKFYVERPDRSSGIGVKSADAVNVGDAVAVYGQTALDGRELVIEGSASGAVAGDPLEPLAMNNLATAGAGVGLQESAVNDFTYDIPASGLCNLGMLVKAFGRVTYVDPAGACFYFDDGSGLSDGSGHVGVRVETSEMDQPAPGSFASVTAVMTVRDVNGHCARALRPRSPSDLQYERLNNYLTNPGFETGDLTGWTVVGNTPDVATGTYYFSITPHTGSWLAGLYGANAVKSGVIYQRANVDPGGVYVASVWSRVLHSSSTITTARSRIGIDPLGGTNPGAASVAWSAWDEQPTRYFSEWRQISTPAVVISGSKATVFLMYSQQETNGAHINCFDTARLGLEQ